MKILSVFLFSLSLAVAQEANERSLESEAASAVEPRLLGKIPDGNPPPPSPPKDGFEVPPEKILESHTHHDGKRNVTIQRITPIPLAPPAEDAAPPLPLDEATKERLRALRASRPAMRHVSMGASIYTFPDGSVRSLVRYRILGQKDDNLPKGEVKLWSNADFSLFPGIHSFLGNDGITYHLMIFWTPVHIDHLTRSYQRFGKTYQPPVIPELPPGDATYTLTKNSATDPILIAPINSLHQIYQKDHAKLRVTRDGRLQAQAARNADLLANPPKPKDITLNYWITETPAPEKGGDQ